MKYRSSRPEVFCKKGVLKNFVKFTGKTPVPESLFLTPATLAPISPYAVLFCWIFSRFLPDLLSSLTNSKYLLLNKQSDAKSPVKRISSLAIIFLCSATTGAN